MAPIKEQPAHEGGVPDVRPLGTGECLQRAIHSSIVAQFKIPLAEYLWPQQVAVGISGGISLLIWGIKLTLEVHPDFVVVKLDLRNAYNEIARA